MNHKIIGIIVIVALVMFIQPVGASLTFIDVSIYSYETEVFVGNQITVDFSVGLQDATGEAIVFITPAPGLSCSICTQSLNFTAPNQVIATNFNLTAIDPGTYMQPFSITSYLVSDTSVDDTKYGLSPIIVSNPACGVDVFNLDVQGDIVSVDVSNTGQEQQEIQNIVFINDVSERIDNFILNPGEIQSIQFTHAFPPGSHIVKSTATASCGAQDTESLVHTVLDPYVCQNPPATEGENRCDFINHQYLVCSGSGWDVLGQNNDAYCNNCAFGTCGDGILNCGETSDTCPQDNGNGGGPEPGEPVCEVKITGLEESSVVSDGTEIHIIEAVVENKGDADQGVELDIILDGESQSDANFNLEQGEDRTETFYFRDLPRGEHAIQIQANAECGSQESQDSRFIIFTAQGVVGDEPEEPEPTLCSLSIDEFNFLEQFNEDQTGFASFTVSNTGTSQEVITVNFLLSGNVVADAMSVVSSGERFSQDLYYQTGDGAHLAVLEASSSCGAIKSILGGGVVVNKVTGIEPQPQPPEEPVIINTTVNVRPKTFDVEIHSSKVIIINITSAEDQTFLINVSGIPADWIDYHTEVDVLRGETTEFIYITPRESGSFSAAVNVTAAGEGLEFHTTLDFFVSLPADNEEAFDFFGWIFLSLGGSNSFITILIVLGVFTVIIVYAAHKKLVFDEEFLDGDIPLNINRIETTKEK